MTEQARQLLERLAAAGKATTLLPEELMIAKLLEADGLVFIIHDTADAIITPKGRNLLAGKGLATKSPKRPLGFIE